MPYWFGPVRSDLRLAVRCYPLLYALAKSWLPLRLVARYGVASLDCVCVCIPYPDHSRVQNCVLIVVQLRLRHKRRAVK